MRSALFNYFIYYLIIFYSIINPAKDLTKGFYAIQQGLASMERVDKILSAENPIKAPENPKPLHQMEKEIEYRDVWFKYGEDYVIKGVNLTIKKGQTVALVGQSGSGKTTMADLVPRFYDVTGGEVLVDGRNVRDMDVNELRSKVALVMQNNLLFQHPYKLGLR